MSLTHHCGEHESGAQDVDGLRELLDDVAPHEAYGAEQHHDVPRQVLGASLTVKVLNERI
jgi:hypothetical protein